MGNHNTRYSHIAFCHLSSIKRNAKLKAQVAVVERKVKRLQDKNLTARTGAFHGGKQCLLINRAQERA